MKGSVLPLWGFSFCLFCSVALAAKKAPVRELSVGTATSSECAACLGLLRFAPSVNQNKAVESLFSQLKERHITIKPSLYKFLALADSHQLVSLCKKTCLLYTSPSPRDRQKSRMPSSA